jgi:PqqD family protein of HPr-rel-A system
VTAPIRLRPREDLTVVELDGESVVYDEISGDLHHLNATATIVFSLCDGTASARDLSSEIAEAFAQPVSEIEPQVRRLLRDLRRQDLLVATDGERV